MLHDEVALALAELGHPIRLSIIRLAIQAGKQGVSVGTIKEKLDVPGSTLTHHIQRLMKVNLISQCHHKQMRYCCINFDIFLSVIDYLQKDCCKGIQA